MNVIEWFRTLFNHRSIIRDIEQERVALQSELESLKQEKDSLEQSIRCRDHALTSLALQFNPVDLTPVVVREVFRRPTYAERQRQYERQNQLRFRQMDEARIRREQQETK